MRDPEKLTEELAAALVADQFPHWAELPVDLLLPGGHDNRTFRLGADLTVRLPTDDGYIAGELKEHAWLERLGPLLPQPIPEIVGKGAPSSTFDRPWSVRRWISGETPTPDRVEDFDQFVRDLGAFLTALRGADAAGAPAAGDQSFHRGAHPRAYDEETRATIQQLRDEVDVPRVTAVWDRALDSEWTGAPVWFHGDVAHGNLLVADGLLCGVIDFGTSGVGDPACDTVIGWTLLPDDAARAFRDVLGLDPDTWDRGRGWALWKALITIVEHRETSHWLADEARGVLRRVLA
ncbi:MAG: aminoglycoside phosphotransferase family protein [Nakamurella sp.]